MLLWNYGSADEQVFSGFFGEIIYKRRLESIMRGLICRENLTTRMSGITLM